MKVDAEESGNNHARAWDRRQANSRGRYPGASTGQKNRGSDVPPMAPPPISVADVNLVSIDHEYCWTGGKKAGQFALAAMLERKSPK